MNWKALRISAALCLLFLVVYGGSNWLTALRPNVGYFYFQWEKRIPFVPVLIIPYLLIDLFFIAAPFVCEDDAERGTMFRRIACAIVICGAFFLVFPLRFAFERPPVDGWLGAIFNSFRTLDQPFNQLPSLHIALCLILGSFYFRHARGPVKSLVVIWFALVAASTVLVYQHHCIDVAGGFVLGVFCVDSFGEMSAGPAAERNIRAGLFYLAGSVGFSVFAVLFRPLGLLLFWPAASLGAVAAGYLFAGGGIYHKRRGRFAPGTYLRLLPVLLGQRLSLWYYARRSNPWDPVDEHLWIGRRLSDSEARGAIDRGVRAVIDLSGEFPEARPFLAGAYLQLDVLDLTAPTRAALDEALDFIEQNRAHGVVYVHCKAGYSRSAAVAGAYLLSRGLACDVDQAVAMLRSARPGIVIRPEIRRVLEQFAGCISPAEVP